jgi:hypothetical protein
MPDGYNSDSSDNEERLLSLGPLNDVDSSQQPARYATLADFSFLTRKLQIDTDAGPGVLHEDVDADPRDETYSLIPVVGFPGCGGVSQQTAGRKID